MNEAIRQKHQIEMLSLDRLPSEHQSSTTINGGSARVCRQCSIEQYFSQNYMDQIY